MAKGSEELTKARADEIVDACAKLYQTMGFREITIKEISTETSFSRPSIYNYFETKEEIFLALLGREYELWTKDVEKIVETNDHLSAGVLASALAHTLENRIPLLKIQAMNLYEIEDRSREERLVAFKKTFRKAMLAVERCLTKFLPEMTEQEKMDFRYSFFPFLYGIYPYVYPTEKQCKAMEQVGLSHPPISIYDITCRTLRKLLRTDSE